MPSSSPSANSETDGPQESGELIRVYRTLPAKLLGWAIIAAVLAVGFIVVRGEVALGRDVFLPSASLSFIVVLIWIFLLRPSVELRSESVTQRNILKDTVVPFTRLSDVSYQWSLELTDTAGRTHSSWAVPKQREFSARRAFDNFGETTARRKSRPGTTAQVVAGDVQREYQRWLLDGGRLAVQAPARPHWALSAVLPLLVTTVLLVLAIVTDGA
ncbi:MAG: hypothetical protein WA962_05710 [Ornithinimicrobium sp.]